MRKCRGRTNHQTIDRRGAKSYWNSRRFTSGIEFQCRKRVRIQQKVIIHFRSLFEAVDGEVEHVHILHF